MAVWHQLIKRPPSAVWDVLDDGTRYADWVVGTARSRPADAGWPEVGSKIEYEIRFGLWSGNGHTVVMRREPPRWLELEAFIGPLGSARIAIDIRPWADDTLVILDEHPLRGPGGLLHNAALDALIQIRHRGMLPRLAGVVEGTSVRAGDGMGRSAPAEA